MIKQARYEVQLRLDDVLIGDAREIAQNLTWTKCRTSYGVDSINFTLNDRVFEQWCEDRGTTAADMLTPYGLDVRIVRDGEEVVGGYLATMPAYQTLNDSANLQMRFDGYMNLLAGVYLRPTPTTTKEAGQMVKDWIDFAVAQAASAGRPFGITASSIQTLAPIQRTFDNYKPVKEAITDLVDNVDGAGPFDVIFNPDRSYYITNQLGRDITDWELVYPAGPTGKSVLSISAPEVQGFASFVISLGAGEVSSDPAKNTAIVAQAQNAIATYDYGYVERLMQHSSISRLATLQSRSVADVEKLSDIRWQPQITLSGTEVAPSPTDPDGLWIGDMVSLNNTVDPTGKTSGIFRINKITVAVSPNGGEIITPELERA